MEVNQKTLAACLGLSGRRIRQLIDEVGLFEAHTEEGRKRRTYSLEKSIQEYINYKLEGEAQKGAWRDKEREQAEHELIKKNISILKLRKLRRELHEASDVEEFLTDMLVGFKKRLTAIPQKVAPLLVAEDDINVILDILEKEIFETLEELSEYDPDKIDKESKSGILLEDEEAEEDDEGEE